MKIILMIICPILFLGVCLHSQDNKQKVVKAGISEQNSYKPQDRFRYPDFIEGQIHLKNGDISKGSFNYDLLLRDMAFILSPDTLYIVNKKDISYMTVGQDTFYYDNGYIEQVSGGRIRIGIEQYYKIKDITRKGAFGTTARSYSVESHKVDNLPKWRLNEDYEYEKTQDYFFSIAGGGFVQFTKNNVLKSFPQHAESIKAYFKSNKIDFNSIDDILKLTDYLGSLLSSDSNAARNDRI